MFEWTAATAPVRSAVPRSRGRLASSGSVGVGRTVLRPQPLRCRGPVTPTCLFPSSPPFRSSTPSPPHNQTSRGSCLFVHSCHDRAPFVLFSPLKTGHRRWARTPDEGARRSGAAHPICPVQRSSVLLFPRYPRPRGYPSVSFVSTAPLRKTFYLPLRAAPLLLPPVARPHWPW